MVERTYNIGLQLSLAIAANALVSMFAAPAIAGGLPPDGPDKDRFSIVYAFTNSPDGAYPWAGLVLAPDGDFYGTTWAGGKPANCNGGLGSGCGTLYRLDSSGNETTIHSFKGAPPGPIHARGRLLPAGNGGFYGMTEDGGNVSLCYRGNAKGCGTVFKLDSDGNFKILYNFGSQGGYADAVNPGGGLVWCGNRELCGTSASGGSNYAGSVFQISGSGEEKLLYQFSGGSDGAYGGPDLLAEPGGYLYGVATNGGGSCNCGTVFELGPNGTYTVLYTFPGGAAGGNPYFGLARDSAGNLYGTTAIYGDLACGNGEGCGVVFKLTPDGTEAVLHAFSGPPDGALPSSQLTIDSSGNLYGTTWVGGAASCGSGVGCGTVFEITAAGKERILHRFHGKEGGSPFGQIHIGADGGLVGTASLGGNFKTCPNGCGVVYKLGAQN